jgi:hypothetical protein
MMASVPSGLSLTPPYELKQNVQIMAVRVVKSGSTEGRYISEEHASSIFNPKDGGSMFFLNIDIRQKILRYHNQENYNLKKNS